MDAVTGLILCGFVVAVSVSVTDPFPYGVVVMAVALIWRSRWPTAVCIAVAAGAVLAFPQPIADGVLLVVACVLVLSGYAAAVYARYPWFGPALLALTVAPWAHGSRLPVPAVAIPFLILGSAWFAGVAVRARAHRADTWRAKAAQAAADREDAYRNAVRDERSRIARELHDIIAHRVSVMVIGAGAARLLLPGDATRAVEQLRTVESGGREALAELRGLLNLLATSADEDADLHPQPGLAAIPALIERVNEAGLPVTYLVSGHVRHIPVGLDLAAFRIVQEALTNSLRHSDGAGTRVAVEYADDALTIRVADTSRRSVANDRAVGGGRGLIGIQERAAFYGGSVTVVDRPGSPFAMAVQMMIPADPAVELS